MLSNTLTQVQHLFPKITGMFFSSFLLLFFLLTQAPDKAPSQASGWRRGGRKRDQGASILPLDWLGPSGETGDPATLHTQNCQLNRWITDSPSLSFSLVILFSSPPCLSFSVSVSLRTLLGNWSCHFLPSVSSLSDSHAFPHFPACFHSLFLSLSQHCVGHFWLPLFSSSMKPSTSLSLSHSPFFSLFHHLCWLVEIGFDCHGTDSPVITEKTLWPWGPAYSTHMQMYVIISLPRASLWAHWPMVRCSLSMLSMLKG